MIEIMQIIFQRPKMFGDVAHRDAPPKKVKEFFEAIRTRILEPNDDLNDDERIRQAVIAMVSDVKLIDPHFRTLLNEAFDAR